MITEPYLELLIEELVRRAVNKLKEGTPTTPCSDVPPRLLTVEQAARYIGRTETAVQHLVSDGQLSTVRSDRRVFIDVRDLDQWIEDNKRKVM